MGKLWAMFCELDPGLCSHYVIYTVYVIVMSDILSSWLFAITSLIWDKQGRNQFALNRYSFVVAFKIPGQICSLKIN